MLRGIEAAAAAGFASLKIDTVVMRGVNDDELVPLLDRARRSGAPRSASSSTWTSAAPRAGRATASSRGSTCSGRSPRAYGAIEPIPGTTCAPAERFRLKDGTVFGIIASTTDPFCSACDRSRLTADGLWYLCLYAARGLDLRKPLREGASDEELRRRSSPPAWGSARGPRRRGAPGDARPRVARAADGAEERPAPRDAHRGG